MLSKKIFWEIVLNFIPNIMEYGRKNLKNRGVWNYRKSVLPIGWTVIMLLFVMLQSGKHAPEPMSEAKRFALYSEMFNLTSREMEILQLLKDGRSDLEIADKLYISKNTVRFHISNLLKKTKVSSRIEAVQSLDKFYPEK